jgi:hypothetical protein
MKRLTFCLLSLCVLSLSGCCCTGGLWPFCYGGGGCGVGACAPGGYPGAYPGAQVGPTSWDASYAPVQTGVPNTVGVPIAAQPIAYPQQAYPTMALESLPTYR